MSLRTAAKLDALLAEHTKDPYHGVPRVVVMVADKNGIIYEGQDGYEQLPQDSSKLAEAKRDISTSSLFELWSCTKLVASISGLQLIERGIINEDDPVSKHVPEIVQVKVLKGYKDGKPVLVEPSTAITVKMLLNHTAGFMLDFGVLPDYHKYCVEELGQVDMRALYLTLDLEKLAKIPLIAEPGSTFAYGVSLDWLTVLVERVTGKSIEDYFKENIFEPLKINDMSYKPNPKKINMTIVNANEPVKVIPAQTLTQAHNFGGAGLIGSPKSYIRIVQALLNGGEFEGARILKPDTVDNMFVSHITDEQKKSITHVQRMVLANYHKAIGSKDALYDYGYGGSLFDNDLPNGRSKGSLEWSGSGSTWWSVDRTNGIAYVIFSNTMPLMRPAFAQMYADVESAIYEGIKTSVS